MPADIFGPGKVIVFGEVIDKNGQVLPAVREVLKVVAAQDLVLQTGHISAEEALPVLAAARDMGVKRMVVTHAQFTVTHMTIPQMKQAAALGAKMELCAIGTIMGPAADVEWMRSWRKVTVNETVDAIRQVGAQHFVLGTDMGAAGISDPADGLQNFVVELMKAGVTKDQVRLMGRETTGSLLMG